MPLVGLNFSGAGFAGNVIPGINNRNYIFPTEYYFSSWSARGVKLIRFPILWERLQPALGGELDSSYAQLIDGVFYYANKYNMKVILDLHNYARYRGAVIGTGDVSYESFRDVTTKIARRWSREPALYGYDIMNEPHDATAYWPKAAQYGIDGIRMFDSIHKIFIEGNGWAEATRWPQWNDSLLSLQDPAGNLIYEAHVYFDEGGGGTYANIDPSNLDAMYGVNRVKPFVDWLKKNNKKGYIGEFGAPDNHPHWMTIMDNMLAYLRDNCIPSTYWAAGPGWGNYNLSVEPVGAQERPQWPTLRRYLEAGSCSEIGPRSGVSVVSSTSSSNTQVYLNTADNKQGQDQLNLIQQLYLLYLGRPADAQGLAFWRDALADGRIDTQGVIREFSKTPDYYRTYGALSTDDFVRQVFFNVLGRDPSTIDIAFWKSKIESGEVGRDVFIFVLLNSLGSTDLRNIEALTQGAYCATQATSLPTKANILQLYIIERIYVGYLDRAADRIGLVFWGDAIVDNRTTIDGMLNSFSTTTEYVRDFNGTLDEFVSKAFKRVLARDASSVDIAFWKGLIEKKQIYRYNLIYNIINSLNGADAIEFNRRVNNGFCLIQ